MGNLITTSGIILLFAALFPLSADAADERISFYAGAAQLVRMCPVDGGSDAQRMACQNYIAGAVDAMALVRANEPKLSSHLGCVAASAQPDELRKIVSTYIANNPASLTKPAVFIVREAILKAFPCPAK
jgi:hypothetical protein